MAEGFLVVARFSLAAAAALGETSGFGATWRGRLLAMGISVKARHVPGRLAAGAFVLHSGWGKWRGEPQQAAGVHGTGSGAFSFLKGIPPERFLKLLSAGEIAVGAALLAPIVPAALAGAGLTAFSGSLLAMYWRT